MVQKLTEEKADQGVRALIGVMGAEGTKFYRSDLQRADCGPEGILGADDVVLIKINGCLDERGMTNTDLVKDLIGCIVNHPDGFTGEVVIIENRQLAPALLDSPNKNNAVDHRQSFLDVAAMYSGSHSVSAVDLTGVRTRVVREYSAGDGNDGYVKDVAHDINYPKFSTVYGTRISVKNGVWDGSSYDNGRLKLINVPVLKSHVYAGVTAATKLYMGLWSTALTDKPWNEYHADIIKTGGLGRVMAYARFPSLNIMDAVWINPDLYSGPYSTYGVAVQTAKLLASTDPIALDYYASKHVMLPVSGYARHNPDNTDSENPGQDHDYSDGTPCSGYPYNALHQMLASSAAAMRSVGLQVTMDESRINVYTANAVTLRSVSPGPFPNNRTAHVVITGTGLARGARVRLEHEGQEALKGASVSVRGTQRLECDFDMAGAMPGSWDVVVENPDHATARLRASLRAFATTFYFAEGTTRPGFDPYLCIQNPGSTDAEVTITYMLGNGGSESQAMRVPKNSRSTVAVKDKLGSADDDAHDFSARVECTNSRSIIVERPMYFCYVTATGGHDVVGAVSPAKTFYFAEGSCRGTGSGPQPVAFYPYLCIQNPGSDGAVVKITYMKGDGTTVTQDVNVPGNSRVTVSVRDKLGSGDDAAHDFSAKVECTNGRRIIAERPMYFYYNGATGGHDVVGAREPAATFYFAEGSCRPGFEPYFCIQNPGSTDAVVKITYMKGDGSTDSQSLTVTGNSRSTVKVKDKLGVGDDSAHDFSAKVQCTNGQKIIAERPMYFWMSGEDNTAWTGGHDVIGATAPASTLYFAEGTCRPNFVPYICIQNPGGATAIVKITYMKGDGTTDTQDVSVPGNSRVTVAVRDKLGKGDDAAHDFSARVECTNGQGIIAERPMYFCYKSRGIGIGGWDGGHDVVGFSQ
jgi:ribosomal protein L34